MCVTKLCVKGCVCDKIVRERLCVTKLCVKELCVTNLYVPKLCERVLCVLERDGLTCSVDVTKHHACHAKRRLM